MKKRMVRWVLGIWVFALAHNGKAVAAGKDIFADPIRAQVTRQFISFQLDGLSPSAHWSLALEPDSGLSGFAVAVGYATPWSPTDLEGSQSAHFERIGQGSFSIGDSEFHLQQSGSVQSHSVWMVSRIPSNQEVMVYRDGKVAFQGKISQNTVLVDGNVAADHGDDIGMRSVMMLMVPGIIGDEFGIGIAADSNGHFHANTAELRRHLQSIASISGPFDGQSYWLANGKIADVLAKLRIDADGNVSEVELLHGQGSGPLAEVARTALEHAKFEPFADQTGRYVAVQGTVQVSLSKGDPEARISIAPK